MCSKNNISEKKKVYKRCFNNIYTLSSILGKPSMETAGVEPASKHIAT